MDLIDRAALKADISLNYGSVMDAVIVNRIINQQKGINLQPVEQGKWIGEEVFADSSLPPSRIRFFCCSTRVFGLPQDKTC